MVLSRGSKVPRSLEICCGTWTWFACFFFVVYPMRIRYMFSNAVLSDYAVWFEAVVKEAYG